MKSVFKAIILLMIVIVIFAGCSTPQSQSSGGSDSKESKSKESVPFDINGISASKIVSVDSSSQDYENGFDESFFYAFWKDKEAKGGFPANQGTAFMYTWQGTPGYGAWAFCNNAHGIVGGRGWDTGKVNLVLTFHGWSNFYADQAGVSNDHYFGVYGWADNNWSSGNPQKLIEYYVVEMHGDKAHGLDYNGGQGTTGSTSSINGSNYTAYKTRRVNKPSIKGNTDFDQYWSVRATQRQSGTMNFASHVTLWKNSGWTQLTDSMMNKSGSTYQILFVEAPFDANTGTGNGFAYIDSYTR